jgi:hypothetical protein
MINVLESQLTIAAVLLDLYAGVKDRAEKQLISKNEMGAHLVNLQNILKKLSVAIIESKKHKKDRNTIPPELKSDLLATEDAFHETFEHLKEYYDEIPDGFEPVAESFKKNIPDDINWIAYNNHQGEA